ncbi:MAG: PIG-L family deacetylase [Pelagimonas sp.]|nr:PIG-L family deacetylase [Pelagimonas sp.]
MRPVLDLLVRMLRPAWVRRRLDMVLDPYERFGPVAQLSIVGARHLAVIAPHPDDEALGAGGLIAVARGQATGVTIHMLTRGTQGAQALRDPGLCAEDRAQLETQTEQTRARELAQALEVLDAGLHQMDGTDGALVGDVARLAQALVARWQAGQPDLIAVPFPTDRHRDHAAAARVLAVALRGMDWPRPPRILCYETWSPAPVNRALPLDPQVAQKKWAALACHVSQVATTDYVSAAQALTRYRAISLQQATEHAEGFCELTADAFCALVDGVQV